MGKRRRRTNSSYLKKRSTTDPDATLFYRPGAGNYLSYKAHISTDMGGIITAVVASPSSLHDTGAIPALIESHEKILGVPSWIAADTKYGSEECLKYLQDKGIKTSINPETKSNRPKHYSKEEFNYNRKKNQYICPEGNILERKAKNHNINRIKYQAKKEICLTCAKRDRCIDSKSLKPRIITRYDSCCYDKAKRWYYSKYGRFMQKLRNTVCEGVISQAKTLHGMARSKFRGLSKVETQFLLTATAINLKKIVKMLKTEILESRILSEILSAVQIVKKIFTNLFRDFAIEVT